MRRWGLAIVVLVAGCGSSAHHGSAPPANVPISPSQTYLSQINALCEALEPKVVALTKGGSLDVPVADYLAQQPAHAALLAQFDADVAKVGVPPSASSQAEALKTYVAFATALDAKRLAAAGRGEAAYAAEVKSEAGIEDDPAIKGLTAAGFDPTCTAR